jgi:hypothetical protein
VVSPDDTRVVEHLEVCVQSAWTVVASASTIISSRTTVEGSVFGPELTADKRRRIEEWAQSSSPSSHTVTPLPNDLTIQWMFRDGRPHPFIIETSSIAGLEIKKLRAFEVEGDVIDFFLRADAFAHTIRLQLHSKDIDNTKRIVRTAPNHIEFEYRWPFDGTTAKFTYKDKEKKKLTRSFEPILDGRGIDLKNFTECLPELTINDVFKGAKVSVEYIPIPYDGRKPSKNDSGFAPGCTLRLVSIILLEGPPDLGISSPHHHHHKSCYPRFQA